MVAGDHGSRSRSADGAATARATANQRAVREQQIEQTALDEAHARRTHVIGELDAELAGAVDVGTPAVAARVAQLRSRRAELSQAADGLIFGRLDTEGGLVRRIGRVGISAPEPASDSAGFGDAEPLVIDWRAPAARPFYTATAIEPCGIRRRRHVRTAGAQVTGIDDELLTRRAAGTADGVGEGNLELVGEGALLASLGQRRTGTMTTAVATLQREQDEIIRADPSGPLIVQGGPGTGKTVVALHRVAYLLFSSPQVRAGGVLVLGPSQRFIDYISQVLPALGESASRSSTMENLLAGVQVTRDTSRELAEIKGRADWQEGIEAWVAGLLPEAADFPLLRWDGEEYQIPPAVLRRLVAVAEVESSHRDARVRAIERIEEVLLDLIVERTEAMLVEVEEGLDEVLDRVDRSLSRDDDRGVRTLAGGGDVDGTMSEGDIQRLRAHIATDRTVRDAVLAWWPLRDPEHELARLLRDRRALTSVVPGLSAGEVEAIVADAAREGWSAPDLPLLDAMGAALGRDRGGAAPMPGAQEEREREVFSAEHAAADPDWVYGHIVVDEAQELSAMQWQMVRRRCPARSITAVGDLDQIQAPHRAANWAECLAGVLGDRWREYELTICYRTPEEVMALTEPVLRASGSSRRPPRPVRASGIAPRDIVVSEPEGQLRMAVAQTVRRVVEELSCSWAGGTVGVVCSHAWLDDVATWVDVPVLPAALAKGLEWDATVVVDPDGIAAEPRGWNRLYVALTRCTQQLVQIRPATSPWRPGQA